MEIISASAASFISVPIRSAKASARFFSTATAVLMRITSVRELRASHASGCLGRPGGREPGFGAGIPAVLAPFLAEVGDRRAVAAVGMVRLLEAADVGRPRQVLPHRTAQRAGAVAVDDPHGGVRVEHRAIE